MPSLDRFPNEVTPGNFTWMVEYWTGADRSHDYSIIDEPQHRNVFRSFSDDISHFLLPHEAGLNQGRLDWDLEANEIQAAINYTELLRIGKEEKPNALLGVYGLLTADDHARVSMSLLDWIAESVDYLAPKAYMREKSLPEFRAKLKQRVAWCKQRWPDKPVYLCSWHKLGFGFWDGQYLSPPAMYAYIEACRDSGADGLMWWAGQSEGVRASDGIGTTNLALEWKANNHPHRWNNWSADWAEVLRQFEWSKFDG